MKDEASGSVSQFRAKHDDKTAFTKRNQKVIYYRLNVVLLNAQRKSEIMGHFVNLPPRYIDPLTTNQKSNRKTEVQFSEHILTFRIDELAPRECWYSRSDISKFHRENWKPRKDDSLDEVINTSKTTFPMGKRDVPAMEDFQTFAPKAQNARWLVVRSVLLHQAACRSRGLNDPFGYAMISKALSKQDKKRAWKSGFCNAYEVECLKKGDKAKTKTIDSAALLYEYFVDNIHQYLKAPSSISWHFH